MKRVLVTGAQGFVGRWLVDALDRSGQVSELLGLGRSAADNKSFTHQLCWNGRAVPAPLPPDLCRPRQTPYRYRAVDICDLEALTELLDQFRPHWVFHMASGLRDDAPGALCRSNVEGTAVLTQALAQMKQRPESIVYGSSGSVYGVPQQLPLREDAVLAPCTLYGVTKRAAEQVSALLAREHELPLVWARLFNLVGPGQDERHVCGRFAATLAAMPGSLGPHRMSVGPLAATRDFIDVRDAASALLALARFGAPPRAYNVASGQEVAITTVLDRLIHCAGLTGQVQVKETSARAGDVDRHWAEIDRLLATGYTPRIGLTQSLQDLMDYYRHCVRSRGASHTNDLNGALNAVPTEALHQTQTETLHEETP